MVELKISRLDKSIDMPFYAYEHDAAFDLRSSHDELIKTGEKKIIKTGIKMAIPEGFVGLIWDRSGLAAKHSLHCLAGVIDSGYRGEVGVVMINLGNEDFQIEKNTRIAQMLIQPIVNANIKEVDEQELDNSKRGEGGFGSSGIK